MNTCAAKQNVQWTRQSRRCRHLICNGGLPEGSANMTIRSGYAGRITTTNKTENDNMSTAQQMYQISLDQITALIKATGHKRTTLVQGHMGTGKSSLLSALARELPTHTPCYFDCTTKDLGDITLPNIQT